MKRFRAIVFCVILFAPVPWGIAINYQTKECAGYWGGDEFVTYTLPNSWKEYYPDDNGLIQTEIGACQLNSDSGFAENCCKQLGLAYVSDNIGEERGQQITHSDSYSPRDDSIDYLSIVIISIGILVITALVYGLYRELKRK